MLTDPQILELLSSIITHVDYDAWQEIFGEEYANEDQRRYQAKLVEITRTKLLELGNDTLDSLQRRLDYFEKKEDGQDICEACGKWFMVEDMVMDAEDCLYFCRECAGEFVDG